MTRTAARPEASRVMTAGVTGGGGAASVGRCAAAADGTGQAPATANATDRSLQELRRGPIVRWLIHLDRFEGCADLRTWLHRILSRVQ